MPTLYATLAGLRRQDWAFGATLLAAVGAVAAPALGAPLPVAVACAAGAVGAAALGRRWSRIYPAPMPHSMRWILYVAHPGLSPRKLLRLLGVKPGMRVLEIGPGVGHHALPTALRVAPDGQVDALDIQPEMLRDLQRRAQARGVTNVVTQVGDALQLPYDAATFDAAYLITVLGEIPHPERALRELARVVKPGGSIAVGEIFLDPDYVSPARMRELAETAGLVFEHQAGTSLVYFARLRHAGSSVAAASDGEWSTSVDPHVARAASPSASTSPSSAQPRFGSRHMGHSGGQPPPMSSVSSTRNPTRS